MKLILFYFDNNVTQMFVEKTNEEGKKLLALTSPFNFVSSNELVAKIIEVESEGDAVEHLDKGHTYFNVEKYKPFKIRSGIYFDEYAKAYKSSGYGFVIYDRVLSVLNLISPIQVSKDKLAAHFIVVPTKFKKLPSYKEIEEEISSKGIVTFIEKRAIDEQLENIDAGKKAVHKILVAKGRHPVNGYAEYFEPLITYDKKAGKVLDDGRIDYKEVQSINEIKQGQELLRRIPAVKAEDGFDIYGERKVAEVENKKGFIKGDNVIQSTEDRDIFVSAIDGCLDVNKKRISVQPIAMVRGNVDYDYGNIEFNGSVHVKGSVLPGFSVKAQGDIIIGKNVDDANIEAGGNVIVKNGITGKGSCSVIAGGYIKAGYILNSSVEAVGKIEIEDSVINSNVFSNDMITVTAKHGKIIGGKTTARHEIIVNVAGTSKENSTTLAVGKSLFIERELVEIKKEMDKWRLIIDDILRKIKSSFGEGVFENPKEFLKILPPVKKKNCLLLLKELSEANKEMKILGDKRRSSEEKLKLEREPYVIIYETVFPGTDIYIKKRVKKLDQKIENAKFYEDSEEKLIRITSAK